MLCRGAEVVLSIHSFCLFRHTQAQLAHRERVSPMHDVNLNIALSYAKPHSHYPAHALRPHSCLLLIWFQSRTHLAMVSVRPALQDKTHIGGVTIISLKLSSCREITSRLYTTSCILAATQQLAGISSALQLLL